MKKCYFVQQAGREAHVYIYGDITTSPIFEEEVSAFSFAQEIRDLDVDVIHVRIDSYGGAVSEGWAMYSALKAHPARIVTHGDGFVASAALYPFMAGDERILSNLSALFFHQVLIEVRGNADDLRTAAEEADKLNEIGISAFENAGVSYEIVQRLEKAETWLSPEEALEMGFATAITRDETARQTQSVKRDIMQRVIAKAPEQQNEPAKTTEKQEQAGNTVANFLLKIFG